MAQKLTLHIMRVKIIRVILSDDSFEIECRANDQRASFVSLDRRTADRGFVRKICSLVA